MKKINYSRLIFEFVSVSFAVLFALFVNQWRENYNNKKLANKAVINIKHELNDNIKVLNDFIPQHQSSLKRLDSIISLNENSASLINSPVSLDLTILSSSAWEMAKITNAIYHLNFDGVNNLAKVYALQAYYESIVKQYLIKTATVSQENPNMSVLKDNKQFLETIIPIEEDLNTYLTIMLTEVLADKE